MVTMPGMRQDAGGLRLAEQALAQPFALAFFGELAQPDALDRDHAADGRILRFIDDAHGAAAQLADDPVAPDILHGCVYFTAAFAAAPRRVQWPVREISDHTKIDHGGTMAIKDALLPEFDHEMATARKVIERVPEDKFRL